MHNYEAMIQSCPGLGWAGLHLSELGWAGLGWAGLGWAGLGWAGLTRSVALLPAKQCCMRCVSQLTLQSAAAVHLLLHAPTERRPARIMHCFCGLA